VLPTREWLAAICCPAADLRLQEGERYPLWITHLSFKLERGATHNVRVTPIQLGRAVMSHIVAYNRWPRLTVIVVAAALAFFGGAVTMKPAAAAFVGVGVGIPGYYYAPASACADYYPYGCYGYTAPYYAPAGVVAAGWGWGGWGWGGPCWGCGRFFHNGRLFFRDGRFVHDGRFFRDGRFVHNGRFFRDGRFVHNGRFFRDGRFGGPGMMHGGFGGPGMMHGGFGGPGMMRGGFGGPGMMHGGFGGGRH
jgi:hypothetical protein